MLEKHIQSSILQYLAYNRVFHWRNNTGAMKTEHGGFIRFGAVGSPDIFAMKGGVIYGIEVKNEKGKQSEDQKAFQFAFEASGGKYILARSIDDVASWIK